jgi:lipopolysaccharide export system protein LptA
MWLAPGLALLLLIAAIAPAAAQTAARGEDAQQPIEISADSLEVKQNQNLAVFRGNVDAVQGAFRLRANEVLVHYRPGQGGTSNISRIDATGKVRFATATETADGEAGVYDVVQQVIVLTGDVRLKRGDNVLRGDRLTMNLQTGESRIEGPSRVKGLFQPQKKGT